MADTINVQKADLLQLSLRVNELMHIKPNVQAATVIGVVFGDAAVKNTDLFVGRNLAVQPSSHEH
jgi:hypothetical protein